MGCSSGFARLAEMLLNKNNGKVTLAELLQVLEDNPLPEKVIKEPRVSEAPKDKADGVPLPITPDPELVKLDEPSFLEKQKPTKNRRGKITGRKVVYHGDALAEVPRGVAKNKHEKYMSIQAIVDRGKVFYDKCNAKQKDLADQMGRPKNGVSLSSRAVLAFEIVASELDKRTPHTSGTAANTEATNEPVVLGEKISKIDRVIVLTNLAASLLLDGR